MAKISALKADLKPGVDSVHSRFPTESLESYAVVDLCCSQVIMGNEEDDGILSFFEKRVLTDFSDEAFRAPSAPIAWIGIYFSDRSHVLALACGRNNGTNIRRCDIVQLMDPEHSILDQLSRFPESTMIIQEKWIRGVCKAFAERCNVWNVRVLSGSKDERFAGLPSVTESLTVAETQ